MKYCPDCLGIIYAINSDDTCISCDKAMTQIILKEEAELKRVELEIESLKGKFVKEKLAGKICLIHSMSYGDKNEYFKTIVKVLPYEDNKCGSNYLFEYKLNKIHIYYERGCWNVFFNGVLVADFFTEGTGRSKEVSVDKFIDNEWVTLISELSDKIAEDKEKIIEGMKRFEAERLGKKIQEQKQIFGLK